MGISFSKAITIWEKRFQQPPSRSQYKKRKRAYFSLFFRNNTLPPPPANTPLSWKLIYRLVGARVRAQENTQNGSRDDLNIAYSR